jgi:hypothetical protein
MIIIPHCTILPDFDAGRDSISMLDRFVTTDHKVGRIAPAELGKNQQQSNEGVGGAADKKPL